MVVGHGWAAAHASVNSAAVTYLQAVTDKDGQNLWEGIGSRLHQFQNSGIYGVIK